MTAVKSKLLWKLRVYSPYIVVQKTHLSALLKMTSNCIFCNICSGSQPTQLFYEDDDMVIFRDIKPAAKYHYLAVSKAHIKDVNALTLEHKPLLEKLIDVGKKVLEENGGDTNDLRMGFHVPPFNSIQHLHLHLISPASEASFLSRMIFKPNTWWFVTPDVIINNLQSSNKL